MRAGAQDFFIDAATYTLDDKARVALPAAFRFACSVNGQGPFVLTVGADGCLAVYPMDEWKRIQRFISPQFLGLDRARFARYTRFLFTRTTVVNSDPQGRIRVPHALLNFARLEREVLIISMGNRLELWNQADQEKFIGPVEDFADAQSRLQFDTMVASDEDAEMAREALAGLPGGFEEV